MSQSWQDASYKLDAGCSSGAGKALGQSHVALELARHFFLQPVAQPFFELMLRALRDRDEADTSATASIGPGNLAF